MNARQTTLKGQFFTIKWRVKLPKLVPLPYSLFACMVIFLSSCASVDPVVKIGLVGPFEGANRAIGYDAIYAARLAVREMNAAGGIGGYRVALVALDDGGDPALARETAVSLTIDPAVIAVIGHALPETTAAAQPIYAEADLRFVPLGDTAFGPQAVETYTPAFIQAYEAVTPFDEQAGPYAGPTYDAFQLLFQEMETAVVQSGTLTRQTLISPASD